MDIDLVPGGRGRNYTGILTKTIVYVGTLIIFLIGESGDMRLTLLV